MSYAARGWRTYDGSTIKRLLKEGRGNGEGADFKPWLTVRDLSSLGLSTRDKGWKTQRVHHVLSKLELWYLYCLEWSRSVIDIREQYPLLPLDETRAIAQRLGIEHPRHPTTREPVVLTTDFLVTRQVPGKRVTEARTSKPEAELAAARTLAKFEIERLYWAARGVSWGIVTEHDLPLTVAKNVEFLHEPYHFASYTKLSPEDLEDAAAWLTWNVLPAEQPLRRIASQCDRRLGFEPGTSLTIAYSLIATRQWQVDLSTPLNPSHSIALLGTALNPTVI